MGNIYEYEKMSRSYIQREIDKANKRINRLNNANLNIYNNVKFSIKGIKSGTKEYYNIVNNLENFLNQQTSTLTGMKQHLAAVADNVAKDTTLTNTNDMRSALDNFFDIAAKTKDYFESLQDSPQLFYQDYYDLVKNYVEETNTDLADIDESDIDKAVEYIKANNEYKSTIQIAKKNGLGKIINVDDGV